MSGNRFLEDLAEYASRREARALLDLERSAVAGVDRPPRNDSRFELPSGELLEHVEDHLHPDNVADVIAEAGEASPDSVAPRAALRACGREYLARGGRDADRELADRESREPGPPGGFEVRVVGCEDPSECAAAFARWGRAESERLPVVEERRRLRDAAAERVGARTTTDLLALEHAGDPATAVDRIERSAIEPLDHAFAEVVHARRHRFGGAAASATIVSRWPDASRVPPATWPPLLRRLGSALGEDPDACGPEVTSHSAERAHSGVYLVPLRPVLVPGSLGGVGGLREVLGSLGVSVRASFLERSRGPVAVHWGDPTFVHAMASLFRRLPLVGGWFERAGHVLGEQALEDLRHLEALAPREDWAYLGMVVQRANRSVVDETFSRATGYPAPPGAFTRVLDGDPAARSRLRGLVYGLLIEDRLLTRFGRRWPDHLGARDWLRECWEAEYDETPERMCSALNLGTLEPTPILDRCRP